MPTKSAWLDATNADYRQILQQFALYNRALAQLSHLGAHSVGKPFVFSGRFAKVCTTF